MNEKEKVWQEEKAWRIFFYGLPEMWVTVLLHREVACTIIFAYLLDPHISAHGVRQAEQNFQESTDDSYLFLILFSSFFGSHALRRSRTC